VLKRKVAYAFVADDNDDDVGDDSDDSILVQSFNTEVSVIEVLAVESYIARITTVEN
jgi:hypothetical protein